MSYHNLVNKRKTIITQQLSENYIEQQSEFLSYILFCWKKYNYPLSLIENMDEILISFNLPNNITVE